MSKNGKREKLVIIEHKPKSTPAKVKHAGKTAPAGKSGGKSGKTKSANSFSASASYNPLTGFAGKAKWVPDADAFAPIAYARGPKIHARLRSDASKSQNQPDKDSHQEFDELIDTVQGSTGFSVQAFDLNPGLPDVFPILAQKAKLYQGYVFGSCEIYYCPTISQFTATGKVMMSCDLEGLEIADPESVAEMENNSIHSDGMPHEYIGFDVAGVTRKRNYNYVREGPIPVGADPRLCDIGRLYVATSGTPTGQIGELRIRGNVTLKDVLQPIERFSLPYFVSQTFLPYSALPESSTFVEYDFTDVAPTTMPFSINSYNPYRELVPMNLSGWNITGGDWVSPNNAVYDVRWQVTLLGKSTCRLTDVHPLVSQFELRIASSPYISFPNKVSPGDAPLSGYNMYTLSGSAFVPILRGSRIHPQSYFIYDGAEGDIVMLGGVVSVVTC